MAAPARPLALGGSSPVAERAIGALVAAARAAKARNDLREEESSSETESLSLRLVRAERRAASRGPLEVKRCLK